MNNYTINRGGLQYAGCTITSATGEQLQTPALPELRAFQRVDADSVYSASLNSILSLTSGDSIWSSPNPSRGKGAVAGGYVVFASGATVRAEPY